MVLKDFFRVGGSTVINDVIAEVATVVQVLDEEENEAEELTTSVDDPTGEEVELGSS